MAAHNMYLLSGLMKWSENACGVMFEMLGLGFGVEKWDFDHMMMKIDFNGQLVTI